jgi:hypothetical protein
MEDDTAPNAHRFGPAAPDEDVVFGACCPGWHSAASHEAAIADWLSFMRGREVERVCCLVPGRDLDSPAGNVERYRRAFGRERVRHAPLSDHRLADPSVLEEAILPFLDAAASADERVVVHCLTGLGRTGQTLAAWLAHDRGYAPERAVETVEAMGRAPDEPVRRGDATEADLYELVAAVRGGTPLR